MTRLLTILFSLVGLHAQATNYYVGSGGSDIAAGTSIGSRWLTLTKVNSFAFTSGDSVLFNRGDSFYGSLAPQSGVIYSAYGSGTKPIITGFTTLSSWTSLGGNLYRATLGTGSRLNMLTVDGAITAPGRYPNYNLTDGGYLTVASHTPTSEPFLNAASSVTISGLTGSWAGAEIVVRKNSYTFDRAEITNHTGTTLNYVSPSANEQTNGFGIFIQHSLATLDATNEWFYSASANTITIYGNPAGKVVKAATVETLVSLNNKSNVKFINLAFEGSDTSTFHIYGGSSNITISKCDLNYNFEALSTFQGESESGLLVDSCTINNTASSTIQLYGTSSSTIRYCTVTNNNLLPGLPRPVQSNGYNTCYLQGSGNLIEYNVFQHSGGPCLSFNGGSNNTIQYNLIQDFCNVICDFGGIYTNGAGYTNNKIINNTITDGVGNWWGTDAPFYHSANGIYLDESASNVLVQANTITRMSSNGIYNHVSDNNTLRGNTIYDCKDNSISLSDDEYPGTYNIHDMRIVSNILFAKSISQGVVYMQSSDFPADNLYSFGYSDSNLVARPFMPAGTHHTLATNNVFNFYDLPGWATKFGWDTHGSTWLNIHPFKVSGTTGGQLFANSTITSTSGFNAYTPIAVSTDTKLDGTALKVTGTPSTDSITKQRFEIRYGSIPSGHTYMATFSMIGSTNMENVQAFWIDDPNNYNRFGEYSYHAIRTTRVEDTVYVTTNGAKSNMSLVFEVRPNFTPTWFDNVKLQEVTGSVVNIDDSIRHEYNASSIAVDRVLGNNYRSVQGVAYTGKAYLGPYTSLILKREINASPDANAGSNISLTLPTNSTALSGSGTDADGTISAYKWTQVSGPNTANFSSTTVANPNVSAMIAGNYSFQLVVKDNAGFTDSALVQVLVNSAANQLPTANAGPDQTKTLPTNTATLAGSGTDPDGTVVSYLWTKTSGPTYSINNPNIAAPILSNLVQGTYVFDLQVTDNSGGQATDQMTITVNAASNQLPTANGGGDQTTILPKDSVTLVGSGSDADGTIVSYNWVKVAGPVTYTIVSPSSATTVIRGLVEGTYTFRLTVQDNMGATAYDDVNVTVRPVYVPAPKGIQIRRLFKVQKN